MVRGGWLRRCGGEVEGSWSRRCGGEVQGRSGRGGGKVEGSWLRRVELNPLYQLNKEDKEEHLLSVKEVADWMIENWSCKMSVFDFYVGVQCFGEPAFIEAYLRIA